MPVLQGVTGISSMDVAQTAGRYAFLYVWRRVWFGTVTAVAGVQAIRYLWNSFQFYRNRRQHRIFGEEAAAARHAVLELLEADGEWTEEDLALLKLDVTQLLEKLRSREITSVQAVRAYLRMALECSAERNINCVSQPVLGALEHAARCDALLEAGQEPGLLHGLPVSLKDNFDIGSMRSHWGVASQCSGAEANVDCLIVQVLKSHGAVPFVKTNIPQTMLSFECSHPVYGMTLNPLDPQRGPGGSSGGEAALMAMGGSLLGMGTDIAGSTRIPAAFCGIVGYKPTMGRISGRGVGTALRGITGVGRTAGMQARDVAGCRLLMEALCCPLMWRLDQSIAPVPFSARRCTLERTLRIGYYAHDGYFTATPAYRRAVDVARQALQARGHEMVPFTPPRVPHAMSLYYSIVGADGGRALCTALENDVLDVSVEYLVKLASRPSWIQRITRPVAALLWPTSGMALCKVYPRRVDQLWALLAERQAYIQEFITEWEHLKLDAVICPSHAMGPPPLGKCASMTCSFSYTMLFNLLDFPAGVVPVSKVETVDELALRDTAQSTSWDQLMAEYSKGSTGLPVAVQCASLPWQDETCLYLMQELETAIAAVPTSPKDD